MNYRHAYHAGNFADVLKHIVLAAIVEHLKGKESAFRLIDSHAGIGVYDLGSVEAQKTGEWRDGIGRLMAAKPPAPVAAVLAPYLDVVRALNPDGPLTRYPGSPEIARRLARKQDRLTLVELHPDDQATLAARYGGDHQIKLIELDAWLAMRSFVPPKEKRGAVLIDPAFEDTDEYVHLASALFKATRRWSNGTYAAWYPIKTQTTINHFYQMMIDTGIRNILRVELNVGRASTNGPMKSCGMLIINPPWTLEASLRMAMPWLTKTLAQSSGARHFIDWLVPE
ncbi:23S rRNA (adenine(2030)-N(6))-methyltransferase RlmJ [Breoghania sp. L-A4]|uniref:23S rRNA (adenine(2030)-N(6))-methyltransferase RlmJ n=1 Tax=Breoghania sp. L-A4 TaxID=2304600 RepID=UPI000E35BF50|nr:23S rRNA (adenine(2030)-N(6))-methyltransferase RlmJ [Breoghania sp. L-A4]AXS40490.1 23S rRNA (adenine(2030)-N(6))-methyltransferase RlmJ [Breoghania sp. L-A4]